jgi:hypothetical protein
MQAGQHVLGARLAVHQGHLLVAAVVVEVTDRLEFAVHGGQRCIHHAFHTGALGGLLAEHAKFVCHDLVPKQRRKAGKR